MAATTTQKTPDQRAILLSKLTPYEQWLYQQTLSAGKKGSALKKQGNAPSLSRTPQQWANDLTDVEKDFFSMTDPWISSSGAKIGIPVTPGGKPVIPPGVTITTTPYPKWWKDAHVWTININQAGSWQIINPTPGYRVYIATLVFTVSGETNITLDFGPFGPSGPMDFGGDSEPRGIVMSMADAPAPCGETGFKITSDGVDIHVNGFVVYFYEKT